MRISDWSSDVCSSDLGERHALPHAPVQVGHQGIDVAGRDAVVQPVGHGSPYCRNMRNRLRRRGGAPNSLVPSLVSPIAIGLRGATAGKGCPAFRLRTAAVSNGSSATIGSSSALAKAWRGPQFRRELSAVLTTGRNGLVEGKGGASR